MKPDTQSFVAYWLGQPTADATQLYREQMVVFAKKALRLKSRMNDAGHILTELALDAYEREGGLR